MRHLTNHPRGFLQWVKEGKGVQTEEITNSVNEENFGRKTDSQLLMNSQPRKSLARD